VTANSPVSADRYDALANELTALRASMDAQGRKVPNSLYVETAGGLVLVAIGPSGFVDTDGNPQNSITINDPTTGAPILKQSPATVTTNPDGSQNGSNWFWRMDDAGGRQLIATDGISGVGLAFPKMSYPMEKVFPFTYGIQPYSVGSWASISVPTTETILYNGYISRIVNPLMTIDGTWGGGSTAVTFRLYLNGTLAYSWTQPAGGAAVTYGQKFTPLPDPATWCVQSNVNASITAQASGSTSTGCAVQLWAFFGDQS
jgi:hypothetical protein